MFAGGLRVGLGGRASAATGRNRTSCAVTLAKREREARAAARERRLTPLVAIIAMVGGTLGFTSFLLSLSGH